MLWHTSFDTAFGWVGLVGGTKGLKRVFLPLPGKEQMRALIGREFPDATENAGAFRNMTSTWKAYFEGKQVSPEFPLDWEGHSDFQVKVWKLTQSIPWGQVRTYKWVSAALRKPGSARAVGSALGKNPFPIVVPCHRVVRRDGALGGFTAPGGITLKQKLLEREGIVCNAQGRVLLTEH
jgi:methylated-DNA-[protein]-cysteine S-methyltransferase